MNDTRPGPVAPGHSRRRRAPVLALLAVVAAAAVLVATLVLVVLPSSRTSASAPASASASDDPSASSTDQGADPDQAGDPGPAAGTGSGGGEPGPQDGRLDDAVSPFDDGSPAIARLRPDLRAALQEAARDAKADRIRLVVTSGWRSERYQRWLYDRKVASAGAEAAKGLVATGSSSRHLTGQAVDVGRTDGAYWMQRYGSRYGLCQMYDNEVWHYELATTPGGTCPEPFAAAADRP